MRLYARRVMCVAAVSISTLALSLPVRGEEIPWKCVYAGCMDGGNSSPSKSPSPPRDYEGERRAREVAAAEKQRQKDEAEARIKRERVAAEKREQEKRERERREREKREQEEQAELIRNRDETARDLETSSAAGKRKVVSGLNSYGLKGNYSGARESQGPQTAWKQLHCAAEIAGFALAALGERGDFDEFGGLSIEALKSLDGQRVTVECHSAPPFPNLHGPEDMDRSKQAQRTILSRARVIAERMKQRQASAQPSQNTAPTGSETPDEKTRRVTRALGKINSEKVTGKTHQEINQQEKDRKALANLVLANNSIEKGNLEDMSVGFDEIPHPQGTAPSEAVRKTP